MRSLFFFILLFSFGSFAQNLYAQDTLNESKQMVLVTTADWDAVTGNLQRYARASIHDAWKKMGNEIPVVIGKTGMALGVDSKTLPDAPLKREGDNKTPAGIYLIGPGFGFAEKSQSKLDYFPLTATSQCVDDTQSSYYNQLLDSAKVPTLDWHSAEQMRQVELYKIGSMVQYNTSKPVRGAGSCIFLHIWRAPTAGTAGCIAMEEEQLATVLNWLDSRKTPMIVLVPLPFLEEIKKTWDLRNF